MNLKVEREFQEKIPPLTEAEFEQLKENILNDGEVYEPIVVWNGVIVDGHNRWKIIKEHPEIPYRIKEMDFTDKWAAFDWMYKKQLGRRNLTDEQKTYLLGKLYEARKNSHGGDRKSSSQNGYLPKAHGRVSEDIAKEQGVGDGTVLRASRFAQGLDAIREESSEAADKILQGTSGATKGSIADMRNATKEDVKKFADSVLNGEIKTKKGRSAFPTGERLRPQTEGVALISRDRDAEAIEYDIEDLLEEMRAVNADFLRKYKFMLSAHWQLVTDNAAEVTTVFDELVSDFEKMEAF